MASSSRLTLLSHRYRTRYRPSSPASSAEQWSLRTILHLLSSQQLTCEELARYCYSTAVAGEQVWELGAFSRLCSWESIAQAAQESDERRRINQAKSPLDGIPISVKANLAVDHQPLTAGSRILGEGMSLDEMSLPNVGYNAAVVQQLVEDCGAICMGITNMDEFGMGSLGTNNAGTEGRATKNPLAFLTEMDETTTSSTMSLLELLKQQQNTEDVMAAHHEILAGNSPNDPRFSYSAGGSSCGAAASVAHGSSLIALGSDTGGSIRLPAAWCGIVGLKTSYGRLSRHGLVSYASSLDTVGFLTNTVECASLVLDELRDKGKERLPYDSNSHVHAASSSKLRRADDGTDDGKNHNKEGPLEGIKIGIPAAFIVEECPEYVKEVWTHGANLLAEAGATVVPLSSDVVSPEVIQQSLAAYYVLASAEASSNLARYDGFRYGGMAAPSDESTQGNGSNSNTADERTSLHRQYATTRTQGFGLDVIRRILCGTAVLSSDKFHTHYEAAAKLRALVTQQMHNALEDQVDFLLIPTVVSPPPSLPSSDGETAEKESGVDNTAMFANDIMTVPISLAGLTAVNVATCAPHLTSGETDSALPAPPVENVVGLQLVGGRLEEENLLKVAQHLKLERVI